MLGQDAPRFTSKTLLETPQFHMDVENPDPGGRPGQLHVQDYAKPKPNKWIYNFDDGTWTPTRGSTAMPNSLRKVLARSPDVKRAIRKAKTYLGVA